MTAAQNKKSIYFGPPLAAVDHSLKAGGSLSGRLNTIAERYAEIIKRHGLELTAEELQVLGDCLSGTWIDPLLIRHLADEIEDSDHAGTEAAKSLTTKIRAASFADVVATVEKLGF